MPNQPITDAAGAGQTPAPRSQAVREYLETSGLSWSSLKHVDTSLLHYLHYTQTRRPDTAAFFEGRGIHYAVFEPDEVARRFGVFDGKRDKRHRAYQEWMAENPGVQAVTQATIDGWRSVADAVLSHPDASSLINLERAEVATSWIDPLTGVLCKGRLDTICGGRVVDLKSTTDISERETGRAAARYLYHGQMAFYHNGAIAARLVAPGAEPPVIIWVEKDPPHDVAVDELTHLHLSAGEQHYSYLIGELLTAIDLDSWPGKAPRRRKLNLPSWAAGMNDNHQGDF